MFIIILTFLVLFFLLVLIVLVIITPLCFSPLSLDTLELRVLLALDGDVGEIEVVEEGHFLEGGTRNEGVQGRSALWVGPLVEDVVGRQDHGMRVVDVLKVEGQLD
jgi:hypothetical protein